MSYEFKLPFPPSVNAWKTPIKNRMILSRRGRDYRKLVDEELIKLGLKGENIQQPLSVSLVLNPPTLRKYDVDNFTKSLFDALTTSNFWGDDVQVQRLVVEKGEKTKGGNVIVRVRRI